MGVPKGRRTRSKQGHRRSHHALKAVRVSKCQNCGAAVLPHRACTNCGHYRGRQVTDVLARLTKRERKEKEKKLATEQEQAQEGQVSREGLSLEELSKSA